MQSKSFADLFSAHADNKLKTGRVRQGNLPNSAIPIKNLSFFLFLYFAHREKDFSVAVISGSCATQRFSCEWEQNFNFEHSAAIITAINCCEEIFSMLLITIRCSRNKNVNEGSRSEWNSKNFSD